MKKKTITIIGILFAINLAFSQNISNYEAKQVGNNIEISYYLDKVAHIEVFISENGGRTYKKITKVSGDIGELVSAGYKKIVWNVLEEYDNFVVNYAVFKIDAKAPKMALLCPQKTFFELNFSWSPQPQMAYGFTVGQFKRIGWYLTFMSNFNFKGIKTDLVSSKTGYVDDGLPFYTGKTSTTRISTTVGFIGKIVPYMAMYVGAGFGHRTLYWETENKKWVKNGYYSTTGVDVETGFLFDIKGFTVSAGVVTTNFKHIDFKVGLGWAFKHKNNKQK